MSQPREYPPGTHLPRGYKIVEPLGSGGLGAVYKVVKDKKHVFAAKVCRFAVSDLEPEERRLFIRRLEREFRLLQALNHPNIVRVYDFGWWGDLPFYVMEYLEGVPLLLYVRQAGPSLREVVDLCATMTHAVAYVHQQGICHRDLQPANMYLCESGRVVLLDFGLSKPPQATPLTGPDGWVGTPEYLSPEYVEHLARTVQLGELPAPFEFSPVQDVYALGVTFYQLMAGGLPVTAKENALLLRDIREKVPRHPSDRNPQLPRVLGDLIMKLLAKDPAQRPADAQALATELHTAVVACKAELDAAFERSKTLKARGSAPAGRPRSKRRFRRALERAITPALLLVLIIITASKPWTFVLNLERLEDPARQYNPEMISGPGPSKANASTPPKSKRPEAPAPLWDQKLPPCDARYFREMNGGCWLFVETERCPKVGYQAEDGCFIPVVPVNRRPPPGADL